MIPAVGRRLLQQWAAAEATTTLLPAVTGRVYTSPSVQQQAEAATQTATAEAPRIVLQQQGEEGVSSCSSPTPSSNSRPRWLEQLGVIRTDWTREEIAEVYHTPILDLVYNAATVHRMYNDPQMVQRCTLLSIKTGGCPENCNYCSQSSHWDNTGVKAEKLLDLEPVYQAALRAHQAGSTRFCMGAAWRGPSQIGPRQWQRVLDMVSKIRGLGMEVCTTLGMVTPEQASQLREAGLTAYNHNLDTSPEYYGKVTTTRKYEDRLTTLKAVRDAGISVCAGGIIGLGEGPQDRVGLIHQLATLPEHPESVPINRLVAIKGTPLGDTGIEPPSGLDLVRCIATARVVMPATVVRLSAGRLNLSIADQAMAFMAGANSIFDGDKLLTTANNDRNEDSVMFETLGLRSRPAFMPYASGSESSRAFDSEAAAVEAMGGSGCKAPNEEAKTAPWNSQAMAAGVGAATETSAAAAAQAQAAASAGGCCGGGCKA